MGSIKVPGEALIYSLFATEVVRNLLIYLVRKDANQNKSALP
jgi:hypothetical protein